MALRNMDGEMFTMKKLSGKNICRVACYFKIMPDTIDGDIISDFHNDQCLILDNKTLEIKGSMTRIGGWHKHSQDDMNDCAKAACDVYEPPESVVITIGFHVKAVPAPKGRFSTILFHLCVNIETGRAFVMSSLIEKRKIVRLVDQIEVPIRNKPGNYCCSMEDGGDGCSYVFFAWESQNKEDTILSLVRVIVDHTAKIKCKIVANQRLIKGIGDCSVKSGCVWFLNLKSKQMTKYTFDGKVFEVFELAPHNGQYPPDWDYELMYYGNYAVLKFNRGLERSLWALDLVNWKWINLLISFAVDYQYGIQGNTITPEGLLYLLGQSWTPARSKETGMVHIHQIDVQKRLHQILERDRVAQAADVADTNLTYASSLPSGQPPPAYSEVEIEEKTNPPTNFGQDVGRETSAEATDENEFVTRL